jgi:dGTPase
VQSDGREEGRAAFARRWEDSRGRLIPEPESATRSPFQRDRDRIVHSTAFRRLTHTTQVFVFHEGDHYRTRLTHSLEVAQIARSMARTLRLDEDLAEAIALAHDLGHTPFGHAGEKALDAAMATHGGFDHNGQSLRVVTELERRYAAFDGLNLTWETLEGLVKHNGPLAEEGARGFAVSAYAARHDLALDLWPSAEAQLAALADDIAYNAHDIDDGFRAGFFPVEALEEIALPGCLLRAVRSAHPGVEGVRLVYELNRRLITALVDDAIAATRAQIAGKRIDDASDVARAGGAVCRFSPQMTAELDELRAFLNAHVYRQARIDRIMRDAANVLAELFERYWSDPAALPAEWRAEAAGSDAPDGRARAICDFIAGMTDRYALKEHRRLFDATPDLR